MLNFIELKQLEKLKKQFIEELNVIDYVFTEDELKIVFQVIEDYPEEERTKMLWQQIVKIHTNAKLFSMNESADYSDINDIHKQIQDLLDKK